MKKLLLALFLACSATAMANHTDPIQEKRTTTTAQAAKAAAKAEKHTAEAAKQHVTVKEENTHHAVADNSRYGIGAYIVEFINRSNIKIMRKILID